MLVLSRGRGERVRIGDDVIITVLELKMNQVRLGIEAPKSIPVHGDEIYQKIKAEEAK